MFPALSDPYFLTCALPPLQPCFLAHHPQTQSLKMRWVGILYELEGRLSPDPLLLSPHPHPQQATQSQTSGAPLQPWWGWWWGQRLCSSPCSCSCVRGKPPQPLQTTPNMCAGKEASRGGPTYADRPQGRGHRGMQVSDPPGRGRQGGGSATCYVVSCGLRRHAWSHIHRGSLQRGGLRNFTPLHAVGCVLC